jgi:hypothetical protein
MTVSSIEKADSDVEEKIRDEAEEKKVNAVKHDVGTT